MGRPPSHGGPSFRFNPSEVNEMEAILQAHKTAMPAREVLVALAEKFSSSAERSGKFVVQMKQVWNWFQNRRYAIRAKTAKSPGKFSSPPVPQREPAAVTPAKLSASPVPQSDPSAVRIMPQAPQPIPTPQATVKTMPQAPQSLPAASVPSVGRTASENSQLEFEAKSARDGAWYDVASFLSYKSVEAGDPEVQVRFAGFGEEEDEWVNVRKHVRQRSLPCESSECVAVLPNDLILCFQEGKEQALYFDAHVLDAQRRRHDVRGCRCRFLVRYDHDQSEEIVPLRKVCRRPETDYRLQQLNAEPPLKQQKIGNDPTTGSTMKVDPPAETTQKAQTESRIKPEEPTQKQPAPEDTLKPGPNVVPMQLQKSGTDSQTGNTLEPTQKQPAPEDIIKPGPNAAPMQLQKSSTESLTGNTLEPTQKQPTPEDTIKPGPNAAPMQLHESSTDSLTDNTLETPKSMEEMPKKPVPEMPEKPVADTAEVPQAEKEELHAESTDKAPAEVTENPSAKTTVEPPAELAENPSAEATIEPPAEVADNPTAEITLEALADSTSKLAEAPAEQSKAEEHVDAEAVVVSADNVNASL